MTLGSLLWADLFRRRSRTLLTMASLAWALDCFDQQIFNLARSPAIKELMPGATSTEINTWGAYTTSIFVAGWATGGRFCWASTGRRAGTWSISS